MQLNTGGEASCELDTEWVELMITARDMGWKHEEIRQLLQVLRQEQEMQQQASDRAV